METFSALLDLCAENSPVAGVFPSQRPVTRGSDVFFDMNKCLVKQSSRRWICCLNKKKTNQYNGIWWASWVLKWRTSCCLFDSLFSTTRKKIRKLSITGPLWGKFTGELSAKGLVIWKGRHQVNAWFVYSIPSFSCSQACGQAICGRRGEGGGGGVKSETKGKNGIQWNLSITTA